MTHVARLMDVLAGRLAVRALGEPPLGPPDDRVEHPDLAALHDLEAAGRRVDGDVLALVAKADPDGQVFAADRDTPHVLAHGEETARGTLVSLKFEVPVFSQELIDESLGEGWPAPDAAPAPAAITAASDRLVELFRRYLVDKWDLAVAKDELQHRLVAGTHYSTVHVKLYRQHDHDPADID